MMKLLIKRIIFVLTTIVIIISCMYLFKLKEEKTNKVPKSATLVLIYNVGVDVIDG